MSKTQCKIHRPPWAPCAGAPDAGLTFENSEKSLPLTAKLIKILFKTRVQWADI